MKTSIATLALIAAGGLSVAAPLALAQTPAVVLHGPAPEAASAPTSVPSLIKFSGTALADDGKPLGSPSSMNFLIFSDQEGGEPLFTESQDVPVDGTGRYSVELGATLPNGIPAEVFSNGQARWLEIQIAGQNPQPRVLLISVPYALKAGDASTLGGLPASAFALAGSIRSTAAAVPALVTNGTTPAAGSSVTTTGGVSGYLPIFSGASTIADSNLFQNTTGVGIGITSPGALLDVGGASFFRGNLQMLNKGAATAAAAVPSNLFMLNSSAWNSASNSTVSPRFAWQTVPAANNTSAPTATLQLLSSTTAAAPADTGFYFNPDGTVHFVANQTFPGTGAITGITAGTGLTGGGTSGNVTLGIDTTKIPQLAAATNAFTGNQSIGGTLAVTNNASVTGVLSAGGVNTGAVTATTGQFTNSLTASGVVVPPVSPSTPFTGSTSFPLDLQGSSFNYSSYTPVTQTFRWQVEPTWNDSDINSGKLNLLIGAGSTAPQESGLSIDGGGNFSVRTVSAGSMAATGNINAGTLTVAQPAGTIASPELVIQADENGAARTAASQLVIQGASDPGQQLLIGEITTANTTAGGSAGTIQSTWNGVENTPLLLNPNGGNVYIQTQPGTGGPLVVGQGAGAAVADGWYTYSSRRFKTNIQPLHDALGKVEQLRGVSYTLKATGKQEIGVIAEEVGAVVPEVVKYEPNGKDATGVDYERLTALLIESTKQQQREIDQLSAKLNVAVRRINAQQTQLRHQAATINALASQVRAATPTLEVASARPN